MCFQSDRGLSELDTPNRSEFISLMSNLKLMELLLAWSRNNDNNWLKKQKRTSNQSFKCWLLPKLYLNSAVITVPDRYFLGVQ